ncbi:MAG: ATP-binding protein [Desulfobacterales bacterium]|jgi:two-component system NtrC family sensor kinase
MTLKNKSKNGHYGGIARNIVFIVLIVSVTPLVLVSVFILNEFQTSYKEKVGDQLELLVRKHKNNINSFLEEKLANIRFLAFNSSFAELSDESILKQKLAELHQTYDRVFVDLGVVNHQGRQVAYAGPYKFTNAQYHDTDWFKDAIEKPFFISDVFLGLRRTPHFIVTVKNETNGKTWLLKATIDFGSFNTIVENLRVGETGFAFILNKVGEFQTKPLSQILPHKNYYPSNQNHTVEESDSVIRQTENGNEEIIYASTYLKNGDWLMVLQQDSKDAFADLHKTRTIAVYIILLGSIGIISTSLILSRRLIKRIARADQEKEIAGQEKEMMSQQVIETGKLASVGELAAGIAHEINNPVAIMTEEAGWIQDLLEEEEFQKSENLQEFHRALEQIHTQGKRCKDITHKLLSFARKTDSSIKDVLLNDLLNEVAYLSSQRAKYSNILINTEFHKDLPLIRASETELQQVFLNLVNNALDAMEKTGGTIDITSKTEGNDIVIVVADNGPGIANANLARIFDPFFTTKPVGKGTGLGLSICYGIINKMGGEIDVRSVIDKGTTFTIRIPANREGEERIAQQSPDFDPDENTLH